MAAVTIAQLKDTLQRGGLPRSVLWPPPVTPAGRRTMKLETVEELREALDLSTRALERQLKLNDAHEARNAKLQSSLDAAHAQSLFHQQARDTWIEAAVARVHERNILVERLKAFTDLVPEARKMVSPNVAGAPSCAVCWSPNATEQDEAELKQRLRVSGAGHYEPCWLGALLVAAVRAQHELSLMATVVERESH